MNVLITQANGDTLNPSYAPEHKQSVIAFYQEMLANNRLGYKSVVITMDDGEVITL